MTLDQLRAMTGGQIKAAITADLPTTKQGLIEYVMGATEFVRSAEATQRKDGQADLQTTVYEDTLGNKTRTVKTLWTYFDDGCIRKVVTKTFDANNNLVSKQVSRHKFSGDSKPVSIDDEV